MGLIKCGLDVDLEFGLPFRLLIVADAGGILEIGWDFQLELKAERGFGSRAFELIAMDAMRCSLAFLDAFVSRANLGVGLRNLEVDGDVKDGVGDSSCGGSIRLWLSLARTDLGAPRPVGVLTNLLSASTDVDRSSNDSNSVPSPKLRLLAGRVMVRLVELRESALGSPNPARNGSLRVGRESRETVPCGLRSPPELSEFVRRDERYPFTLAWCDWDSDTPAGINGTRGLRPSDLASVAGRSTGVLGLAEGRRTGRSTGGRWEAVIEGVEPKPRSDGRDRLVFKRLTEGLPSPPWTMSRELRGPRSRRPESVGVGDVGLGLGAGRLEVDD